VKTSGPGTAKAPLRIPAPAAIPRLSGAGLAALYRAARVGGDFFDFMVAGERLLLLLLDIAGKRESALDIGAGVQEVFRRRVPELFAGPLVNEAEAISQLAHELNRAILAAARGVRCAPGFLGCYGQSLGTLFYVNAGHTPALLREHGSVQALESSGLPLGLFSHATHEAQTYVVAPGGVLLLVSRGLAEARAGRKEFGLERVRMVLEKTKKKEAQEICAAVLEEVQEFVESAPRGFLQGARNEDDPIAENDVTVLALVRQDAAAAALETGGRPLKR
jgi:serine phosphatase RsbU (regulator of sigma subunit)